LQVVMLLAVSLLAFLLAQVWSQYVPLAASTYESISQQLWRGERGLEPIQDICNQHMKTNYTLLRSHHAIQLCPNPTFRSIIMNFKSLFVC
jgi:hypothetical protein